MTDTDLLNGRYQLLEPLGSGGMAQVYRARDLMLERFVAIKVLRSDFSSDPAFQVRFRHEARSAANLSHPNIVTVHDFGFDQGQLFLVMEHVPGVNLKTMVENLGKFSLEDAIPLLVQACAGLGYAHRAGLVHCDVKPHNLLVTPDRRLKVTDFGIARAIAGIQPDEKNDVVWGSPLYFSPEQASGQAPSPASDVYSLGVVMYEMLTGRPPFVAKTAEKLAELHRDAIPQPPSELNPAITPELEQIMLKVLAKVPSARYRTADQLGRVLMTFGQTRKVAPAKSAPEPAPAPVPAAPPVAAKPDTQPVPVRVPPSQPVRIPPSQPVRTSVARAPEPAEAPVEIDWITVGLRLLAFLSVGGLVPFWLMIIMRWVSQRP